MVAITPSKELTADVQLGFKSSFDETRKFKVLCNPFRLHGFVPGMVYDGQISRWLWKFTGAQMAKVELLDQIDVLTDFDYPVYICIEVDGEAFPLSFCLPVL